LTAEDLKDLGVGVIGRRRKLLDPARQTLPSLTRFGQRTKIRDLSPPTTSCRGQCRGINVKLQGGKLPCFLAAASMTSAAKALGTINGSHIFWEGPLSLMPILGHLGTSDYMGGNS
jgi:hypothetical protein